jgi:uncharacterized protein (DUF427 family)
MEQKRTTTKQAVWHGAVLAESDETVVVEGNHYFPPDALDWQHLEPSPKHTACAWKGVASYYDVVVDGQRNRAAAWTYPSPSPGASHIAGYVAFWHGVRVKQVGDAETGERRSLWTRFVGIPRRSQR